MTDLVYLYLLLQREFIMSKVTKAQTEQVLAVEAQTKQMFADAQAKKTQDTEAHFANAPVVGAEPDKALAVVPDAAPTPKPLEKLVRFQLLEPTKVYDSEDDKEHAFASKSELMRFLYDNGMQIADISHFTGNHYSFVYGVISSSHDMVKQEKGESRSDQIREMYAAGKKVGEISKILNANYSFVFGVVKKYKAAHDIKEVG